MDLQLNIITPEKIVVSEAANSIVLPTEAGEINVLPGHIPLLTILVTGEIKIEKDSGIDFIAVDKGFVKIEENVVSVLTEAAIDIKDIDLANIADAETRAQKALEEARNNPTFDPIEIERLEAVTRFAINQKLIKSRH